MGHALYPLFVFRLSREMQLRFIYHRGAFVVEGFDLVPWNSKLRKREEDPYHENTKGEGSYIK
jgi:hypothetical protein